MGELDRIAFDEQVMGGPPAVRGFRVTAGMIVGQIGSVAQRRPGAVDVAGAFGAVVTALRQFTAELAAGALITIDPRRSRASLLPLRR